MDKRGSFQLIRELGREGLAQFVDETASTMIEEEALSVLRNPHCSGSMVVQIAQSPVASRYSVRVAIVGHRSTPQGHAMKFVHHLKWHDLLRLSTEVRLSAAIRRAIEEQMKIRMPKVTLGEKRAAAKFCSIEIARVLFRESDDRVLDGLLNNPRVTEQLVLQLIERNELDGEHLARLTSHPRWHRRYAIRRSVARSEAAPRAVAAAQLPHLTRADLREMKRSPSTSRYLHACIDRLGLLETRKRRSD